MPSVTSVREVDWSDSRNGGFVFVFRPDVLERAPHGFVATLKGPADLRRALVSRSDAFLTLATEKLLIYAMGRPVGDTDMSSVRAIVRRLKQDGNRFSALVVAVTQSAPFRMRVKKA